MTTEQKLRKYFNSHKLQILDNGESMTKTDSYEAVSLQYVYEYVLKKKVTKRFTARKLFKLCQELVIRPVPCDYANSGDLVFATYVANPGYALFQINETGIVNRYHSNQFREKINIFNTLL